MNVDIDRLLTIDVDAEIRKLAEAELQGSWQIPAELVRRALRAGATRVDVELGTDIRVSDDGPGLEDSSLEALSCLLSADREAAVRHRALLELEKNHEVGLIALVGLKCAGLRLVSAGRECLRVGRCPGVKLARHGVHIEVHRPQWDPRQAREWLATAVRYAQAPVVLNGAEIPRGVGDCIAQASFEVPHRGALWLLRQPRPPRAWLLGWGVVTTHVALPTELPVEAALEVGESVKGQVAAAEVRHAVEAPVTWVAAQAVQLAIATASRMGELSAADQKRLREALLAAPTLARTAAVRGIKMFPALHGPSRALEWTSIDQLLRHGQGRSVVAVDDEAKASSAATAQPIFVLSTAERTRLSQLFAVAFTSPPMGVTGAGPFSVRRAYEAARRAVAAAIANVLRSWRSPLPRELLTEEERAALQVLRNLGRDSKRSGYQEVELCAGKGRASLVRKRQLLLLPRDNPDVSMALRRVASDPSWAYPALLMLLNGGAMPPSNARHLWDGRTR